MPNQVLKKFLSHEILGRSIPLFPSTVLFPLVRTAISKISVPVSYTHLDVYKRQVLQHTNNNINVIVINNTLMAVLQCMLICALLVCMLIYSSWTYTYTLYSLKLSDMPVFILCVCVYTMGTSINNNYCFNCKLGLRAFNRLTCFPTDVYKRQEQVSLHHLNSVQN